MFAFALWDRGRGELFLARDRLGKKPLLLRGDARRAWRSARSWPRSRRLPGVSRKLDPAAVEDYLAYGYVPDPATIFAGIRKLPAAHWLLLRRGDSRVPAPVRYWRPHLERAPHRRGASRRRRWASGCARRPASGSWPTCRSAPSSPADWTPAGVVAHAAMLRSERGQAALDTFTHRLRRRRGRDAVRPPGRRAAAAPCSTTTSAAAIDWIEAAREQAGVFGEPFGDASSVPTRAVCALARRHVTVALSGDGGDEVFAGYRRHRWHALVDGVRAHVPAGLRRSVFGGLARAYPKLDRAPRWLRAKHTLHRTEPGLARSATTAPWRGCRTARGVPCSRPRCARQLDGHDPGARVAALMQDSGSDDPLAQAQYVDLHTWLVGDILTKVDRASMAHSLEVRAPLLDVGLVEWGLSLPRGLKLHRGWGKHVLRRALEPVLPEEVLHRRKQGFATGLGPPLRAGIERVRARLLGSVLQDSALFAPRALARLLDEHAAGVCDHGQALWTLLAFEGFLAHEAGLVQPAPLRVAA